MTDFLNGNEIELTDEDGREFHFSLLDFIEYEGSEYAVLLPKDRQEGPVAVFKVEDINGDDIADYVSVDDPALVEKVFGIFKEKVKKATGN
ncbi:MAG: DUF1292 domain-containing protein [Clostridia bacterium]|nr:DUF1292 domain-containing protein [Clostridia bacterium]